VGCYPGLATTEIDRGLWPENLEEVYKGTMKLLTQMRRGEKGFTLIEIMIVVLIIGILLAIAVPNFVRARETSRAKSCVSNMKQIDSAKEQWAMDTKAGDGDAGPAMTAIAGSGLYIKATPDCPSGGTYTINVIGTDPTCDIGTNGSSTSDDHVL